MNRGISALLLCLVCAPAFSQVYRSKHPLMESITLSAEQKSAIKKVDDKYGPQFDAFVKNGKPSADQSDQLDALNRTYSKALLGVMTDKQKLDYLHAVYAHVMDFLKEHPEMTIDEVFMWGGAYAIGPKVDHLPPNYPG